MRTCGHCSRHHILTFSFLAVFFFLICYLWLYALTGADVRAFHEMMMRVAILGYTGHNWTSLLLGLIQASVWGGIFGGIYSIFAQSHECEDCNINIIVE
ncbi:MAG: hypothetical protein WCJ29_03785 [bacterium]